MIGEAVSSGPLEAWPVARTMQALEALAFQPLSAPQVAAVLQIHPRTARRLLTRLLDEGYLMRSDDARRLYAPTMRVVALAGQIVQRARIAEHAVPIVAALHEDTGAVAHLAIPSYRSVLCVVHGNGAGPAAPGLHELAPAHCTATGKALLGHRDAWRDSVLSVPLERRTASTITDPGELRAEAGAIRARGYATEDGENQAGIRGVAAPVFAASGEAVAALGLSTGADGDLEALAAQVVAAARALEAAYG
jgi:IclR family acetate operon transcriptional repressor